MINDYAHFVTFFILIHRFTISIPILALPVFRQLLLRKEKISSKLLFETSEHSVRTADDSSKVISQALNLVLYISKSVVYLNSIINRNQIKDYLTVIEGIFYRFTMAFIGMPCRFTISCGSLLLKKHVPRTQGS